MILAITVSAQEESFDITKAPKGTYTTEQLPLCHTDPFVVDYDLQPNYHHQDEHELNYEIKLILEPGEACQFPFDGTNFDGLKKLYLPKPGDIYSMGKFT